MTSIREVLRGIIYGFWYSRHHLIHSFVIIPAGILVLLAILYGFNILLDDILKVKFPSSVLGMLVNLVVLVTLNFLSKVGTFEDKEKANWKTKVGSTSSWILNHYLLMIKPSMNFCLKWINVFFIPSFIILPLSSHITIVECMKIAAVFVIGGLSLMLADVYMIVSLKAILRKVGITFGNSEKPQSTEKEGTDSDQNEIELSNLNKSFILVQNDITTIDLSSLKATRTEPIHKSRSYSISDNPFDDHQKGSERLKRSVTSPLERGAEDGSVDLFHHQDGIPEPHSETDDNGSSTLDNNCDNSAGPEALLSEDSKSVAIFVTNYIDWFLYICLVLVSLPLYYSKKIHVMLPFHLGITVMAYYIALLILEKYPKAKKFAHPILVSTVQILFICFISSIIYHSGSLKGFLEDLKYYKTGKNYLKLFNRKALYNNGYEVPQVVLESHFTSEPMWPGCGDFLSSLMDISIVSLSLPMFTHRNDFVQNFWVLIPPLIVSMVLTFFCYPIICFKIGISSERSLGFIGRSVTLALGTPLITSLGGSVSLMAVCTILSGICGVLIGDPFFKILKISEDDFVTRGVTLGVNCGAIATAHLLNSDPRAASISSLSFSVFGTMMIILASIGAIRELIQSWVNL